MALVPDQKFSTFIDGGDLAVNDIVVGLRGGLNTRFKFTGELPIGVVVPIAQGGTGATTASGARTNLGLGTIATQNANNVAITGGALDGVAITNSTAALASGTIVAVPSAGTDITNKTYVDSLVADSGGIKSFQVFTSGTAQTYTKPANISSILVEVIGGGGGGAGVATGGANTVVYGGGGGAGGYSRHFILTAAATYTYTVGGGGAGGTAGANTGTTGDTSSFSTVSATGGLGGVGATGQIASHGYAGGIGGSASGGNIINSNGQSGFAGIALSNTAVSGVSGAGGSSVFGGNTDPNVDTLGAGTNATVYGAGGSGASTGAATDRAGGNGAPGIIIVWEFS